MPSLLLQADYTVYEKENKQEAYDEPHQLTYVGDVTDTWSLLVLVDDIPDW